MDNSHNTAYAELECMYNELNSYLESVILGPEHDELVAKCEQLGNKIYDYHAAILVNNSRILSAEQESLKVIINKAKEAREALEAAENKVKILAQVANAIDKVFEQLSKFL